MGDGRRVLIVDDYEDARELYAQYLRHVGYEVATASEGNEALRCALHETCDVIVLDVALPTMDGMTILRLLRANSKTKDIPVIMLSAAVGETVREQARDAGASMFLGKPCLPEELEAAIRQVLSPRKTAN
jgi:DNA-binding response OmpR family regulator